MYTVVRTGLALILAALFLQGCGSSKLFEAPPRGGTATSPTPALDSVVTLVAKLPYTALVKLAEAKIPQTYQLGGSGDVACLDVPHVDPGHIGSHQECFLGACTDIPDFTGPSIGNTQQCASYHWSADIIKNAPVSVGQAENLVRVSLAGHISGQAGLGGDLAGLLSLSGKNFDVSVAPVLDLAIGLDPQWCPIVSATPVGEWVTNASVEIVGRNCIGIDLGPLGHPELCAGPVPLGLTGVLNDEFEKHRGDISNAAATALSCEAIRTGVAQYWHPIAVKIDGATEAPVYLNIEPNGAGASGLIAEADGIKLAVRVSARTSLSPNPVLETPIPLPPLEGAPSDLSTVELNVEAEAPYGLLSDELRSALKGKSFKQNAGPGDVEVRIEDAEVYPSGDRLVVGIQINAKTPGRWFDTSGWIYLSGKPRPINEGKGVTIEELGFATVLDNAFWSSVQGLFEGQILSAIQASSTFDLSGPIDQAADKVFSGVANASIPGLRLSAEKPTISLASVTTGAENLVVVARLSMAFAVELTEALVQ